MSADKLLTPWKRHNTNSHMDKSLKNELLELKEAWEADLVNDDEYRKRRDRLLGGAAGADAEGSGKPAATLVELLGPGMEVGPEDRLYRLERFLGEGGMGVVWLALDLEGGKLAGTDKRVALKFLPADVVGNLRDEQRLKQEAERAQQLGHPNIVRVWGWRRDPQLKLPFLEMEYLEGEDLNALLHREGCPGLSYIRVMELMVPVAEALKYAWEEHQIVHRDIKPGNLYVTKQGRVKLLDFGIAAQARRTASSVGPASRTPGYHAPEAAGRHKIDPKLDAYSVAAVIYELLEGELAFDDRRTPHTPWPEKPQALNDRQWQTLQQALAFTDQERLESAWGLIQGIAQGRGPNPEEQEAEREARESKEKKERGQREAEARARRQAVMTQWHARWPLLWKSGLGLGVVALAAWGLMTIGRAREEAAQQVASLPPAPVVLAPEGAAPPPRLPAQPAAPAKEVPLEPSAIHSLPPTAIVAPPAALTIQEPSMVSDPGWGGLLPAPNLTGGTVALTEWRLSENRSSCRPLAFLDTGATKARVRRANFAGGWAIAFDLPGRRSAFGIAGTGTTASTDQELRAWPYYISLAAGSVAGYGLSGGEHYPKTNPEAIGQESVAYLRVSDQACGYHVWSELGRTHLEHLLQQVRGVATR